MKRARLAFGLICLAFAGLAHAQSITSVQDPYSNNTKLTPGGLAVINGTGLGTTSTIVTVGGKQAYVVNSLNQGAQMTIEIPVDALIGSAVPMVVGSLPAFTLNIAPYAPVVFSGGGIPGIGSPSRPNGGAINSSAPAAPGETIVILAIGLGPTTPLAATGVTPSSPTFATTTTPAVSVGGKTAANVTAALVPGQAGIYQVTFTMPSGLLAGSYPVTLTVSGNTSTGQLNMFVGTGSSGGGGSAPLITSIVDGFTNSPKLTPGGYALITGNNLGTNPNVTVGGKTAYNLSPPNNGSSMIIQIPVDAPVGSNSVIVTTGSGGPSTPFPITLLQFAPVILLKETGGNTISPRHVNGNSLVTAASPASPGETISLFASGLGPTIPPVSTGTTPSPSALPPTATLPTVTVGGIAATGVTAVAASQQAGTYFVTFVLPAGTAGGSPSIQLNVGGASSNTIPLPIVTGPLITGVANNYSYIVQNLPNFGIAQGSIFDIFGNNLSQASTGLQSVPLSTLLKGVTVQVTVNGTTTQCLLYYVTPNQIAAILPSATPVGTGTITVTNNGQTSGTAPIKVVQSAFGVLTLNGLGDGAAAAFDVNSNYLGFTNALNPGDYFILWGTGVGPVSGDETVTQVPADLTNVPFKVEVGGVPAQLYYHGRSAYPGLDQVIAIVPPGVTPGCYVSVDTVSGNIVSNFATIPVATSGRTCSEPTFGDASSQLLTALGKSSFNLAVFNLEKDTGIVPAANSGGSAQTIVTEKASAQFLNVRSSDYAGAAFSSPTIGSCLAYGFSGTQDPGPPNALALTPLNAGAVVNITGPNGKLPLNFQSDKQKYSSQIGGSTGSGSLPIFIPSTGGTFTFDNGTGATDVGAFTSTFTLSSPFLNWTNQAAISTVSRANGVTVSWTGGSTGSYVLITGTSYTSGASAVGATFTCTAPLSAGQFTVPPSVLLTLPVSAPNTSGTGSVLTVAQITIGQVAGASTKLDVSVPQASLQIQTPVLYQ